MKQVKNKLLIVFCILLGFLSTCIDDENVDVDIVTNADTPKLGELLIVDKTASTVTIEGEVESAQGYPITERGIVWGTNENLNIENDSHKASTDHSSNTIRLIADDLKGATTYFFRLYATNRAGIGYSDAKSQITNDGLGVVRTIIIHENTHATTAMAGGVISNRGEGSVLERGVYYFEPGNMHRKDSITSTSETSEADSFVCVLSGLTAATEYYVQAYVKNSYGIFRGDSSKFTTSQGFPVLNDEIEVEPYSNYAQVVAIVLSNGDAPLLQRGFCWSKSDNPTVNDNTLFVSITSSGGIGAMTGEIHPLDPNQVYYVRAFAQNMFGITYTPSKQFITSSDMPTVVTLPPTNITNGSAVFGGTILNVGASDVIRIGVCYSTNPRPTMADTYVDIPTSPVSNVPFNFTTGAIPDLKGGTTYYISAYAYNGIGAPSYGDPVMLQTPPIFTQESESFKGERRIEGSSAYYVIGNVGYLLGGDVGPNYISNLYSYNPVLERERWGELNFYAGGAMGWQGVAVMDTRVYVLGGLGAGREVKNDFYVYNSMDNLWYPRATGPDSAYSRAGFSLNDEVVYVGGMRDVANDEVWAFNVYTYTWTQKTDFPVHQYGGIAVTIGGNVYVGLGKNTAGNGNKQLWRSSGSLTSWTPEPVGTDLSGNVLAGVVCNDKIYVIDKSPSPLNRYFIFEYDPANQVWKRKSELPDYNWNIQFMYSINNRIYIGFATNNDTVVLYDPLWDN